MYAHLMDEGFDSMRKILKGFDKTLSVFEFGLLAISAVMVFSMVFIVSYGVVSRYFFNSPATWSVEISEYILVYVSFLSAAWVLSKNGHVRLDLLINALKPKTQRVLNIMTLFIGAATCALFFGFGLSTTIDHYVRDVATFNILSIPKYLLLLPIPIGCLFLTLRYIRKILEEF